MIRKHKNIIIAAALILGLSGSFALGSLYAQDRTEIKVLASDSEVEKNGTDSEEENHEMAKTQGEVNVELSDTQEEISLEFANSLLSEMPDAPLLQKYATENLGDSSLQNCIEDVNATSKDSAHIIRRVCEEAGIDADKAVVKDLTAEQISEIDQAVFEESDHPKN